MRRAALLDATRGGYVSKKDQGKMFLIYHDETALLLLSLVSPCIRRFFSVVL